MKEEDKIIKVGFDLHTIALIKELRKNRIEANQEEDLDYNYTTDILYDCVWQV